MSELQPLHVINVFIEAWFRQEIIEKVLTDFSPYTSETRKDLAETLKSEVKVSGFRNPLTARKRLLVRETEKMFETNPHIVRVILNAWSQLFEKNSKVFDKALSALGFKLPTSTPTYPDALHGFDQGWPEGLDYPKLIEAIRKEGDQLDMTDDQIVLFSILRTGLLPGEEEVENG